MNDWIDPQRRMIVDMLLRDRAPRTIDSYSDCMRKLESRFERCPSTLEAREVRAYVVELLHERKLASSTVHVYISAYKFFYGITMQRPEVAKVLPRPKRRCKLPHVLSGSETKTFLDALPTLRYQTIGRLLYGCGLRLREGLHVQVDDIDSNRMVIHVRNPKNRRDRIVPMSEGMLRDLRGYWASARPPLPYLFPNKVGDKPLSSDAVQKVFRQTSAKLGLNKRVTPHVMRHSYATHQLELDVDLLTLQYLLGHASLRTTRKYLHISTRYVSRTVCPLDILGTPKAGLLG